MDITVRGQKTTLGGRGVKLKDEAPAARVYTLDGSQKVLGMISVKPQLFIVLPSLKTEVCSYGAKKFDQLLADAKNLLAYIVTADTYENIESFLQEACLKNVEVVLDKDLDFGKKYGVEITDGTLAGKLARAAFVIDEDGYVTYTEIVSEITDEIDYETCMNAVVSAMQPKPQDPHHSHENWMRN